MFQQKKLLPLATAPQSICVLRLSAIGDVCHAVAALRAIQHNWPNAAITWVIGKVEAKLVGDIAGVHFVVLDKGQGKQAVANVLQQLNGQSFDVLLHMHASMRANRLARGIQATVKLGFDKTRARDWQWVFTNARIPAAAEQHVLDGLLSFVQTLGGELPPIGWDIPVSADDMAWAQEQLAPLQGKLVLALSPCSSHALRNWHTAGYIAAANYAAQLGFEVVLMGGPSALELATGAEIEQGLDQPCLNLIGKDTLKRAQALLGLVDVLITPDSGPMHMASAAHTHVVGLHAASNPKRSGAYNSQALAVDFYPQAAQQFLQKNVGQMRWGKKIEQPGVMDLVSVTAVQDKINTCFQLLQDK